MDLDIVFGVFFSLILLYGLSKALFEKPPKPSTDKERMLAEVFDRLNKGESIENATKNAALQKIKEMNVIVMRECREKIEEEYYQRYQIEWEEQRFDKKWYPPVKYISDNAAEIEKKTLKLFHKSKFVLTENGIERI